jgi:hypothetical protein
MNDGQAKHLMVMGDDAVTAFLVETVWAMNFFGSKVGGAIAGDEVMIFPKDEGFEHLAALTLPKNAGERGAKMQGIDIIENGSHLRIAGDRLHAEKGREIERIIAAFIVESQQGRGFQGEESKPRQHNIHQRDAGFLAMVWDILERGTDDPNQAVGGEMLPFIKQGHGESFRE